MLDIVMTILFLALSFTILCGIGWIIEGYSFWKQDFLKKQKDKKEYFKSQHFLDSIKSKKFENSSFSKIQNLIPIIDESPKIRVIFSLEEGKYKFFNKIVFSKNLSKKNEFTIILKKTIYNEHLKLSREKEFLSLNFLKDETTQQYYFSGVQKSLLDEEYKNLFAYETIEDLLDGKHPEDIKTLESLFDIITHEIQISLKKIEDAKLSILKEEEKKKQKNLEEQEQQQEENKKKAQTLRNSILEDGKKIYLVKSEECLENLIQSLYVFYNKDNTPQNKTQKLIYSLKNLKSMLQKNNKPLEEQDCDIIRSFEKDVQKHNTLYTAIENSETLGSDFENILTQINTTTQNHLTKIQNFITNLEQKYVTPENEQAVENLHPVHFSGITLLELEEENHTFVKVNTIENSP